MLDDVAEDAPPSSTRRLRVLGDRPKTRGDCVDGARPCPWVSCRHHLFLEIRDRGFVIPNFPTLEEAHAVRLEEMAETCSLDVADRGGATLNVVGAFIGVSRERARIIEAAAIRKLGAAKDLGTFVEAQEYGRATARHQDDDPAETL